MQNDNIQPSTTVVVQPLVVDADKQALVVVSGQDGQYAKKKKEKKKLISRSIKNKHL